MITSRRSIVEALLDREVRQSTTPTTDASSALAYPRLSPSRHNAIWRQKVIRWYFAVVAALRRRHHAASSLALIESSSSSSSSSSNAAPPEVNPFDRSMVHVAASLLDGYLASLSGERAMRYSRDCAAYQLLATTCLLLGMRLAQHESIREGRETGGLHRAENSVAEVGGGGMELRRAKTHRMNMNDAEPEKTSAATSAAVATRVFIPTASTMLRISSAPKSITERHVLSMVGELTGSRSFPRAGGCKVVTALDYVRALTSSPDDDGAPVALGHADAEEARRIADFALIESTPSVHRRPAVLACAAVVLALSRSPSASSSSSPSDAVRRSVHRSILGRYADDDELLRDARVAESELRALRSAPPSRDVRRAIVVAPIPPSSHLIPLEDD
jgi:hypothetical protein